MKNKDDLQNVIVMSIQQAKMTEETLRNMLREFLKNHQQHSEGQTTIAKLAQEGRQLEEIKISEENILEFQKTAEKHNISYALKYDNATVPPTYFVFFKNDSQSVIFLEKRRQKGYNLL
jgi:ribosome biogenesis SPOUT family RNA methylase Rps3